ncbi:MAG: RidA family protein [Bacteroidia bacterium]|nr:RidA family protein [Bacteroidia bacterium]
MNRQLISSGSPWESKVSYSRAVKVGKTVEVSGTTAVLNGVVQHKGNLYEQTKTALAIIEKALQEAGMDLHDVVRTRMYVTDISRWEEAGKAHGEFFVHIRPATTLVEVSRLIDPDMLIEIEATAIEK